MTKIAVSNIYGKYNLGDQAIRNSGVKLLSEIYPNSSISLFCEDTEGFIFKRDVNAMLKETFAPYGYVIKSNTTKAQPVITKFLRLMYVIFGSLYFILMAKILPLGLPKSGFFKYVTYIFEADKFFLMGGGYLVTRNHVRDTLGTILNVIPLFVAKALQKSIVILPISYGPYYNDLHTYLAGMGVANTNLICRDLRSLKLAQKFNSQAVFFPDLALFDWPNKKAPKKEKYFVLTVKNYYSLEKQTKIEAEFVEFVKYIWEQYQLKCIFIPTGANPIEENDVPVGERIAQLVPEGSFEIVIPTTVDETKEVMAKAQFAICTRMHSAIFSAIAYTPFIAIAYEHKVTGFMEFMGLEDWSIGMTQVKFKDLKQLHQKLTQKSVNQKFLAQLDLKRQEIQEKKKALKEYIVKAK